MAALQVVLSHSNEIVSTLFGVSALLSLLSMLSFSVLLVASLAAKRASRYWKFCFLGSSVALGSFLIPWTWLDHSGRFLRSQGSEGSSDEADAQGNRQTRCRRDANFDRYVGRTLPCRSQGRIAKVVRLAIAGVEHASEAVLQWLSAARINTEKIVEYRNERLTTVSPSTVNKEVTVLRAIFYHAFEGYTPPKVSRVPRFPEKLKEAAPRQGFVNDTQYEALQAQTTEPALKLLLAMAYNFGFRRSEFIGLRHDGFKTCLRVKQIDLKDRTIRLNTGETKNGEGRVVKMTEEVLAYMKPCVTGKGSEDAVFTWRSGKPIHDLRGSWSRITKAAKVSVLLHDFRRSATKNMTDMGIDRDVAKAITGHKTDAMFTRYNIVSTDRLTEAASKMDARRKEATK
jgi:integrase